MEQFTREQVDEMVREAVDKTEKSFGGTFKRMKTENEELRAELDAVRERSEADRAALEERLAETGRSLEEVRVRAGELAVREEIRSQLAGKPPLPLRFIRTEEIGEREDPEMLARAVAEAIERGRTEFEETLREAGIQPAAERETAGIPANPALRGGGAAQGRKTAEARDALRDMAKRGLLR